MNQNINNSFNLSFSSEWEILVKNVQNGWTNVFVYFYRLKYPSDVNTVPETIITTDYPTGVAVDTINDHLYWCDQANNQIYRSNLDGTSTAVIANVNGPLDLELDISNG